MNRRQFVKTTAAASAALAMSPALLAAAANGREIYASAISIDALAFASDVTRETLVAARDAGLTAAVCDLGIYPRDPANAVHDLGAWQQRFAEFRDVAVPALTAADITSAKQQKRFAVVLGCQDASILGMPSADWEANLALYSKLGLRVLQITHNERTPWGESYMEKRDGGLSRAGERLVKAMNETGMLIDLSHCSRQTLLDTVALSTKPCAITHAGCRALANTARNKTDEEIKALGAKNGFFGVFNMGLWLTDGPTVTMDTLLRHVDHVAQLIGADKVGIGTDGSIDKLDAAEELARMQRVQANNAGGPSFEWPVKQVRIPELNAPNRMLALAEALVKKGYKDQDVRGIIGENFLRVFRAACG